ncbi:MAG: aldolase/citrate lyase family protein [Paracoccaceae bacterium]|nr:aldolase/citrate lyase family protein [Paracoccaceae bacterium]
MTSPKEKLKALIGRETARCIWLDIPSAMTAEIAGQAGAELCVVDAEHGQIGPETIVQMLRALELSGTPGIVRVGDATPGPIKHALDGGAAGVIVPYVESVAEAQTAIDAFYLPPLGRRGTATIVTRAGGFGADPGYGPRWNSTGLLALMIETGRGLAAAPDIAALEGTDILFFGPYDFATDQGLDPIGDSEAILQAYRLVADAAHQAGKLAAAFPWPGADAVRLLSEGADLVAIGADVIALRQGLAGALAACAVPD